MVTEEAKNKQKSAPQKVLAKVRGGSSKSRLDTPLLTSGVRRKIS